MDADALVRSFGLGRRAVLSDGPVARGRQGLVWRLDDGDRRWAVKVPLHPVEERDVEASTAFQEAARAAGVPTPGVRRTVDGAVFATVAGRRVRLYEWVDVRPPDPLLDPALVGAVVAALHQVPCEPVPSDPLAVEEWYRSPVGAARWDALLDRLRHEGAPFAGRLGALRDELVALETWIEPPAGLRTCHRDLWADNLLATEDGTLCVLDWENAGPADPDQELAAVLFEFGRSDPDRARTLVTAYRAAGGPGAVRRRGHFSMLVAQLGHITEIAASDWLEPGPRCPDRSVAEEWVAELVDEPHSRDVLDTLLAAVADV
jgi:Ser/Thr protein kinase RdoA (MazF antagonist)